MVTKITKLIGAGFTLLGVYFCIQLDFTNGMLAIIAGELIDMPKQK